MHTHRGRTLHELEFMFIFVNIVLDDSHIVLDDPVKTETLIKALFLVGLIELIVQDDHLIVRDDLSKSAILSR